MNTPNWDDLRFFLALSETGTLSGAARTAGVEHSTVARRIDALEASMSVRLFDRLPRGWLLTAAGTALLPLARRVEDDMHALLRAASGEADVGGKVRVSAPPALAAWLLAPRLKEMLEQLPGIEIELRGEARQMDLRRREADIALRFERPVAPGLAVRALGTVAYGLYGGADYLAQRAPVQWAFLGYDQSLEQAPQQQWLDKIRKGRAYALRSNDLGVLYQAAAGGCGVAALPHYVAHQRAGEVELVESEPCPVKRKLWIVMHEDVRRAPAVRAVADQLGALFAQT